MSVINTNVKAIVAQNALSVNNRSISDAMQQLSTGKRINSAKDDAAGLAISQKMTSQIRGLNQAVRNANDGIAMLQTAEGALVEVTNMLQRMRELAVQAATDTNTSDDRAYLDLEYQQLTREITRIADNTQWNGMNILDNSQVGTGGQASSPSTSGSEVRNVKFHVGANADQTIDIALKDFSFGTGTAAVASEKEFNFAGAAADSLSGAAIFSVTFGGSVSITATIGTAVAASTVTEAEATTIFDALKSAINARSGFENVSVTRAGSTINITDSVGRSISNMSSSLNGTTFTAITKATNSTFDTSIAGGSVAVGASTPGATAVFSGTARINDTSITSLTSANTAIGRLDSAIKNVNNERATMGSVINRLTYATDNLSSISMLATESRSRVLDTDYAKATTELAKTQIIQQAATAMLAQANQQPQSVLSLLQ